MNRDSYIVELTGKQIAMLCNCIDERITSNTQISHYTGRSKSSENRSLLGLQRYLKHVKTLES